MWFRLAELLGWPVGHLKEMMSSKEFRDWGLEFMLREDDLEEAQMQARVQEGAGR